MKKILILGAISVNLLAGSAFGQTEKKTASMERADIPQQYKCDMTPLFASDSQWRESLDKIRKLVPEVAKFKGTLGKSAKNLLEYFAFCSNLNKEISRTSQYSSLKSDLDVRNADNIAATKEVDQVVVEYSLANAFASAELAAIPDAKFDKFMASEPKLSQYSMLISDIKRQKPHTLCDLEEQLLSKIAILGDPAYGTFNIFADAEMPNPVITLSNGDKVELTTSEFAKIRSGSNKADRDSAFVAFWDNYKKFEGTFGELSNACIRQHLFSATVYKFDNCVEAALFQNGVPTSVYYSLVDNVNSNLDTFHRYLRLKARLMGVDTLEYSDIYAPCVKDVELNYTYEEAQKLVLEAVEPLGDYYKSVIKRAFDERWIDVMPSKGKRSGAYSSGGAYDVHPYILMNYNGRYDDVSTLIHELGHTMHSYLSNTNQPFAQSHYKIFVAEVASTFNEVLLDNLMLKKLTDKGQRLSLLMSMLDGFRGTLFRQAQFAEFELKMHQIAEQGKPVTGKVLTKLYGDINNRFYGADKGVCKVDNRIDVEWAYIPHFYYDFYVFQYSTSFVASQALAAKVLSGDTDALDKYLHFLGSGCSKYPIELLKDAGIDMTSNDPFKECIATMNRLMDEIEKML